MNFTSSTEVEAMVKDELSSYFLSGLIDDLLFPKWIKYCMGFFGRTSLPKSTAVLKIENFTATLPEDFYYVRSLWFCGPYKREIFTNFTSTFYETDCRITPIDDPCNECAKQAKDCLCYPIDERYRVTHKVTGNTLLEYSKISLLKPSKRSLNFCAKDCENISSIFGDIFDISGDKIVTTYQEGVLHLEYYTDNLDEDGNTLIIDDPFVKDYLIKYLKFKSYEQLASSVSDESLNAILTKMRYYEQSYIKAKIIAETELKKPTKQQKSHFIERRINRFSNYRRSLG